MSHLTRRLSSSSTSSSLPSASDTALHFLTHARSLPPATHSQTLDANQLHRLACTLNRPAPTSAIPACHHLVYFTPAQPEAALGRDGTDTAYNPRAPFTRRMWAGGELRWVGVGVGAGAGGGSEGAKKNLLRVGQRVTETTAVWAAEGKRARNSGEEMVVVGVEKVFENGDGVALVDKRNWIFRPEITTPSEPAPKPASVPFPGGKYTRDLTMSPVMLFRFSALTFNGHKIHYNREWCREVEGHRDLVVHGPLNLINMVDFWRDVLAGGDDEVVPRSVVYRATSPLYAGEGYRIVIDEERERVSEVRIVDGYGNVSMVGRIERF